MALMASTRVHERLDLHRARRGPGELTVLHPQVDEVCELELDDDFAHGRKVRWLRGVVNAVQGFGAGGVGGFGSGGVGGCSAGSK